jgi:hypothetical protein
MKPSKIGKKRVDCIKPQLVTKRINIVSMAFVLLIVSLISGGSFYFWQKAENKKIEPTTLISAVTKDQRKELTAEEWQKKIAEESKKGVTCDDFFESRFSAEPNTTVTYTNKKYGYSIDFPYNPAWGDNENKVKAFENNNYKAESSVWFGAPYPSDGCSFDRINLDELAWSTIDQAKSQIDTENQKIKNTKNALQNYYEYQVVTGLKYPVLKIDVPNEMFGPVPTYRIFLPKVTLELSDPFFVDSKLIEQMVASIKTF